MNNTNVYTSLILKKQPIFKKSKEFKGNVILSSKTATRNIGLKKYIKSITNQLLQKDEEKQIIHIPVYILPRPYEAYMQLKAQKTQERDGLPEQFPCVSARQKCSINLRM